MYPPADYDSQGNLKAPLLFWAVLLLQARTWVLLVLAGASRQQGDALLGLFYPDRDTFWLGLIPGVPAAFAFLLSGRRHLWPRFWRAFRWLLVAAQAALLVWQLALLAGGEELTATTIVLLVADLFALWWLVVNRRLRDYFAVQSE
ncbi:MULTISPECIES: DUF2919 domain-containing protein [Cedecea]|uniref:Inner membrane protein YfeZ n=1 Tax=Cedecea davisae DSM 4568 TaxID=566551 RepID=S3J6J2_9ENTR|nr:MULTISPECIES: DUF2919 domain-containing protein [Cedecea]EPF15627.1 hypothetical protein HMPREF0201_03306 [Cedecea davisae DSM 4568]QIX96868.1 DUF2919 domain-containing protein [Cedecea sp. FDAARGOS_727]SUX38341.1 Inner membrane protein yfeZ [Cedecea davisae]